MASKHQKEEPQPRTPDTKVAEDNNSFKHLQVRTSMLANSPAVYDIPLQRGPSRYLERLRRSSFFLGGAGLGDVDERVPRSRWRGG